MRLELTFTQLNDGSTKPRLDGCKVSLHSFRIDEVTLHSESKLIVYFTMCIIWCCISYEWSVCICSHRFHCLNCKTSTKSVIYNVSEIKRCSRLTWICARVAGPRKTKAGYVGSVRRFGPIHVGRSRSMSPPGLGLGHNIPSGNSTRITGWLSVILPIMAADPCVTKHSVPSFIYLPACVTYVYCTWVHLVMHYKCTFNLYHETILLFCLCSPF